MAYQPDCCSVTLLCPVCISVFCTPLALSVLLPFILSAPYPFNATFLYHAFLLLRSASLLTLESSPRQQPHLFFVHHSYSTCAPCACNIRNASACSLRAKFLHNLSALSDHHRDSSASLVIFHHAFNITGCSAEIPQPLWQLRLLVFSGTVELMPSVSVTGFNAHPSVNPSKNHLLHS
jgi:hypothetical protein